ncbi:hypothetical protein [Pontibacter burrus]|uniref:Uncharacterized protein n=1 Tax=Pontibacter burrus TaxID=2704466 RepID=A0A6B3LJM5_9BACT|nr:hypothetical protein [Pontibacter burrus]NEM96173.1 hypothetical protein [Pontibacter burrus]
MTYTELESLLGTVAEQVLNGSGHFHCGSDVSLKEAVEEHGFPVIHLDPIKGNRNVATAIKNASITIGFFDQGHDLSEAEKGALLHRMEKLSARFLLALEEEEVGEVMCNDYPVENFTGHKLMGWACEFTLKLPNSLCS